MAIRVKCCECGKEFEVPPSRYARSKELFCSKTCHMKKMNRELNPTRMTSTVREKLSLARLGTGEGKTYMRQNGRHVHRTAAEEVLGRPLLPGEVVHHINGDKRDNSPGNLMVFPSQAEHARWHAAERKRGDVHAIRAEETPADRGGLPCLA